MFFHILQYIAQDSSAKSTHEAAQDKTEPHFGASRVAVVDIERLFFPLCLVEHLTETREM